jgi:hypothetical protein
MRKESSRDVGSIRFEHLNNRRSLRAFVDKHFDVTLSTSPLRLQSTLHSRDVPEKNIVAFIYNDASGKVAELIFTLKGGDVCKDSLEQDLNDFFKTHTITKVVHYQLSHW